MADDPPAEDLAHIQHVREIVGRPSIAASARPMEGGTPSIADPDDEEDVPGIVPARYCSER